MCVGKVFSHICTIEPSCASRACTCKLITAQKVKCVCEGQVSYDSKTTLDIIVVTIGTVISCWQWTYPQHYTLFTSHDLCNVLIGSS